MTGIVTAGGGLAQIDSGRSFFKGAGGYWAGQQFARCLEMGQPLSPAALRVNGTLRKDEHVFFDEQLVAEAEITLRGVADLARAGLVINVPMGLGKTVFEYEKVTDMDPATVSLDGISRTENDRQEFSLDSLPLPITHKDFWINIRTLNASRTRGESLDVTQARTAGRIVSETIESMLFVGGKTFGGKAIYGYTTHPDRNTASFGTNGAWSAGAKTGENILADLLTLIQALENDRHTGGPYWLYVPRNTSTKLEDDYKANSDVTIRERLLMVDGVTSVQVVDQLPADNVVLVHARQDVVALVQGERLQTVQWDMAGGFEINFKAFTIQVPLIRSDAQGRSGIVHMS